MSSPSPIQLLAPSVVQRIVSHVVGSSRQVFAGVLANSNEHNKVLKPLMWVSQNFRAIAYPLYCCHFKLDLAGPEYHERSMYNPLIEPHDPGYHMRNDLGYPTHHLAKELTIELEEWAVYDGHALRKLTLAPFEGYAFPLVRSITFHFMMYKPLEFDTHNPPESGAAIGALVERIKQMAPILDEIRVATKVYGRPPDEASEEFSSFVSQFYRIANRIQYGCATESSLSVELQLKGICDLVHINYKVDDNGQQFAQLARLNASTLQSLVARCDLDIGVADLIRKTPRTFMKYPCLHTLKLIEYGTSKTQRRITFKGAVPFPKLRCLYVKLAWPVNDDTFFRGNAATLEYLNMNMDGPVVHALSSLKVFTPGSHPKLKCVKVRLASDTPNVDRNVEAQFMQFILSIGPEAPVRGIDRDDYFDNIKGVLLDLSGTLHIDNAVTPRAVEALKLLRSAGVKVRFVTNSTKTSDERLHAKLSNLGFELLPSEIFTSLSAAKRLIQQRSYRPMLILEDEALEQFTDINQDTPHNAVVIGLAPSKLDYQHMNCAFTALLGGADLVGIHRAKYYASAEGQLSMGPGGFVAALEYATDKKAELVGKPARAFYELALADMGLLESPECVAMVGDDVLADLGGGAQELGLLRALVKTGKYREGDEDKATEPVDGVYSTFADFVDAVVS
ncbi:hypothetical protein IWW39_000159 [Coemansia spiralis]|uniref:Haloacid dehalogenase-like hydrolase domain-containing protein 2 n=1 Tax=Coemansia spiralis TaxID=417178 RepID=A0A9W8GKM0_9FUNG|nr:hypothetical protein IWW39_000159 [Coemansia spiralis]